MGRTRATALAAGLIVLLAAAEARAQGSPATVPPAVAALRRSMIDFAKAHPGATPDDVMAAGDATGFRKTVEWMRDNLAKTDAELAARVGALGDEAPAGLRYLAQRSRETLDALEKAAAAPRIDYQTYAHLGVDYSMAVTFPDWGTSVADSPRSIANGVGLGSERDAKRTVETELMMAKLKLRGGLLDFPVVFDERGLVSVRDLNDAAPAYDIVGLLGPHETQLDGFYDAWGFPLHDLSHHGDRTAHLPADAGTRDADAALRSRQAFATALQQRFDAATGASGPFAPDQRKAATELLDDLYFDAWHESPVDFVGEQFAKGAVGINATSVKNRAEMYEVDLPAARGFPAQVAKAFTTAMAEAAAAPAPIVLPVARPGPVSEDDMAAIRERGSVDSIGLDGAVRRVIDERVAAEGKGAEKR